MIPGKISGKTTLKNALDILGVPAPQKM